MKGRVCWGQRVAVMNLLSSVKTKSILEENSYVEHETREVPT